MVTANLPEPSKTSATIIRLLVARSHRWQGPLPAVVTRENEDGTVNLFVFGDDTPESPCHFYHVRSALVYDPLSPEERALMDGREYAEWVPYQKGQAAKAEEIKAEPEKLKLGKPVVLADPVTEQKKDDIAEALKAMGGSPASPTSN